MVQKFIIVYALHVVFVSYHLNALMYALYIFYVVEQQSFVVNISC